MQHRDEEMEKGAEELRSLKDQIKLTENQMSEKQQFLESEQENNHEKEKVVDVAERQVVIPFLLFHLPLYFSTCYKYCMKTNFTLKVSNIYASKQQQTVLNSI